MKNILKLSSFLVLLMLVILACTQEEDQVAFENTKIAPEEFGFYHNEAIRLYNSSSLKSKTNFEDRTIESVLTELTKLMEEEYPDQFNNVNLEFLLEEFAKYKFVKDYAFDEYWNSNFQNEVDKGNISQELADYINQLITEGFDTKTIHIEFKKLNNFSNNLDFMVFQSIANSSNELWSDRVFTKEKNWCNEQIIISDAAVGAIFWWTGPGGIIAGALSSLVTAGSGDCA